LNDLFAAPIASLAALRREEAQCRRCDLYRGATQLVPGEGGARGVLGRSVTIAKARDLTETIADGTRVRVTIHPSLLLRLQRRPKSTPSTDVLSMTSGPPRRSWDEPRAGVRFFCVIPGIAQR
jgi:uracil-DNA glycosylase